MRLNVMDYFTEINFANLKTSLKKNDELPCAEQFEVSESPSSACISHLMPVNLFVGPNNTGKSRFLRALFTGMAEGNSFFFNTTSYSLRTFQDELKKFYAVLENTIQTHNRGPGTGGTNLDADFPIFNKTINAGLNGTFSKANETLFSDFLQGAKEMSEDEFKLTLQAKRFCHNANAVWAFKKNYCDLYNQIGSWLNGKPDSPLRTPLHGVYIPAKRSLRPAESNTEMKTILLDLFLDGKTQDWENGKINKSIRVVNGNNIYDRVLDQFLTSSGTRRAIEEYQTFLSECFFSNESVGLFPNRKQNVLLIKIGHQQDLPIYALGDGIQNIITLTYDAFLTEDRECYFIDEPELFMHPGLQRRFLEEILNNEKLSRHQWFISTHSNHLLDLSVSKQNISIYKVTRQNQKTNVTPIKSGKSELLTCLGAQASSVFRANSLIWVEGVTDRRYFELFLSMHLGKTKSSYQQDIHYTFIELGGANFSHFSFNSSSSTGFVNAAAISNTSLVILDGDNKSKPRYEKIKTELKENLITLTAKEIENILPENAVRFVAKKWIEKSTIKEIKANQQSILNRLGHIQYSEYSQEKIAIGEYLDRTLGIIDLSVSFFATASGTIDAKTHFCLDIVDYLEQNPETTPLLDEIVKNISTFIMTSNA
ncbi:MAG: AAA family ATPase [Bacteriovoracia bacterium]